MTLSEEHCYRFWFYAKLGFLSRKKRRVWEGGVPGAGRENGAEGRGMRPAAFSRPF